MFLTALSNVFMNNIIQRWPKVVILLNRKPNKTLYVKSYHSIYIRKFVLKKRYGFGSVQEQNYTKGFLFNRENAASS